VAGVVDRIHSSPARHQDVLVGAVEEGWDKLLPKRVQVAAEAAVVEELYRVTTARMGTQALRQILLHTTAKL